MIWKDLLSGTTAMKIDWIQHYHHILAYEAYILMNMRDDKFIGSY